MKSRYFAALSYTMALLFTLDSDPGPARAERSIAGARTLNLQSICDDCRLQVFARCDGLLEGPSAARDGSLYVVSPSRQRIYRVGADARCVTVLDQSESEPAFIPAGTKFGPSGDLYGTLAHSNALFVLDTASSKLTIVNQQRQVHDGATNAMGAGGGFEGFNDLVFDRQGGLYLTDMARSSALNPVGGIVYRTPDGKMVSAVETGLAFPDGIALSPDEKTLYVAEWLGNRILAIPVGAPGRLDVKMTSVFAYLGGGKGPDGMAVDAAGNLYVAHQGGGGEIAVFAPNGSYYGAIRVSDGSDFSPTNLTFQAPYLYVTEGHGNNDPQSASAIWRVRIKTAGVQRRSTP